MHKCHIVCSQKHMAMSDVSVYGYGHLCTPNYDHIQQPLCERPRWLVSSSANLQSTDAILAKAFCDRLGIAGLSRG